MNKEDTWIVENVQRRKSHSHDNLVYLSLLYIFDEDVLMNPLKYVNFSQDSEFGNYYTGSLLFYSQRTWEGFRFSESPLDVGML